MSNWQTNLEIVGAELFQRYRKRLLLPGIALVIREDYPGLSLVDVLVRVHAGRQIIREGDDFRALRAIRNGRWQRVHGRNGELQHRSGPEEDRFSRSLVIMGGALFACFVLLSLSSAWSAGIGSWTIVGLVFAFSSAFVGWRGGLRSMRPAQGGDPNPASHNRRDDVPASV